MREPMRGLGSGYLMSPSLLSSCLATCYRVLYNKSRGADLRADAGTTTGPDAFNDFIVSADHALHLAKNGVEFEDPTRVTGSDRKTEVYLQFSFTH